MDTLSHTVLGACIGEAMMGKQIGKKGMIWGAIAANFPDIDVFFSLFFHPVDTLLVHRGITHSFLFVLIMSGLFGWIFRKIFKDKCVSYIKWFQFFLIALLSHLLLDSCTVYGTGIFEPFSNYRFQFTSLFIIDPLYTLPLFIAGTALLILKKNSLKRNFWCKFGIYLSTIYLLFAIGNKLYMENVFANSLKKQSISVKEQITAPTALNNILWSVVAKDTHGYWIGFYSHFDKSKKVNFLFIPRNDSLAGELLHNKAVQKLIKFSSGYYCFTQHHDTIYFNDLRFAFVNLFHYGSKNVSYEKDVFVFSLGMIKDPTAPYGIHFERNVWSRNRFKGLSNLVKRIKGI